MVLGRRGSRGLGKEKFIVGRHGRKRGCWNSPGRSLDGNVRDGRTPSSGTGQRCKATDLGNAETFWVATSWDIKGETGSGRIQIS